MEVVFVRAFICSGILSLKLWTGLDTPKGDAFTLKVFCPESVTVAGPA